MFSMGGVSSGPLCVLTCVRWVHVDRVHGVAHQDAVAAALYVAVR